MEKKGVSAVRPRYGTVKNAADYLGLSRAKLYAEKKAGRIKFTKFGNATRVEYDECDRYADEVGKTAAA